MTENSTSDGPKEACKTYIEQTKLLVTLASAFVVAPAAMIPLFRGEKAIHATESLVSSFFYAEIFFVLSVLSGYVVLASIAGLQHLGQYDVHRPATRVGSLVQISFYVAGLWKFIRFIQEVMQQGT